MTNGNKKWLYFSLGALTVILGWVAYTLYHIFGKPVLPTVKLSLTVDEDAEYEAALKQYSEAVMSLEKQNFNKVYWEDLKKTLYSSKNSFERPGRITYPDSNSLFDLDDTQPIKIDLEPSAKDLEDWAEYIG